MEKAIDDFLVEVEEVTGESIRNRVYSLLEEIKDERLQKRVIDCLMLVSNSWHDNVPLNFSHLKQEILDISCKLGKHQARHLENIFLSKLVFLVSLRTEETKWIIERRNAAKQSIGNPYKDAVGLALSGGGVRSATFNLGLLQAFEHYGILQKIDYLSTVSGGGYIGSSLTWITANNHGEFPFGTSRKDHSGKSGKILAWLREHGNYLTPGDGLRLWSLIGATFGAILTNLLVLLPWIFFAVWLLSESKYHLINFKLLLNFGISWLVIFMIFVIVFDILTYLQSFRKFKFYRKCSECGGGILMFSAFLITIGTIPNIHDLIKQTIIPLILSSMSISITGILSFIAGLRGLKATNETKGIRSLLLSVGLSLILYGFFLLTYHFANTYNFFIENSWVPSKHGFLLIFFLIISIVLAKYSNINYTSLHRFYRNRLMEAYMPWDILELKTKKADKYKLCDILESRFPYQIINTTVNMVGSKSAKYSGRGGDNFIFSKFFCGSNATGYTGTSEYVDGNMNLATALAISGAAVDPNTYVTRSKPITFLMTLLNIRLGYWIANPRSPKNIGEMRFMYYWYMFAEMFGKGLNEYSKYIHLSDGGQFENLGLYELVRRRCKTIIVSDASSDPTLSFGDLAKAIELVRVDFGAKVDIDTRPLRPKKENRISDKAFVKGRVIYKDGATAELIYINTVMISGLTEDLYSYRRTNWKFPDQTTLDQFFDEAQFEAYRELGYQIGKQLYNQKYHFLQ